MKNLNRRRLSLNKKYLFYFTIFIIILFTFFIFNYEKKNIFKLFKNNIELFSKNFHYQYKNLEIVGAERVKKIFILNKLDKYHESSIFLLPLDEISKQLNENNWIKSVNIKTNYKDTIYIKIEEFKPQGIYQFNNKYFYFDGKGKIIDEYKKNSILKNKLLIFNGQSSNLNAKSIISTLNSLNFQKQYKIKYMEYIEKRRWNIILKNNMKLMLSEEFPKKSLENFIKIEKNLSETDLNNIKTYDLRNISKVIVINE
tara:strand:+ start:568 stop:1335 length:768 start_codon:yes stop_codon:yes gene_type:complete